MTYLRAQNIVPLGTFKATATSILRDLGQTGEPLVLTQHGRPSAVVLSPHEYDALVARDRLQRSIAEGLADFAAGRSYTTEQVAMLLAGQLQDAKP